MNLIKILLVCSAIFVVACGGRDSEKSDAVELLAEVERIGVKSFSDKTNSNLSIHDAYYVEFGEISALAAEIKVDLMECYLIGEKSKPHGLSFTKVGGRTYYVSLDGTGVPEYFKGYKNRKILENVYRLYR